jgi:hypothetical protein
MRLPLIFDSIFFKHFIFILFALSASNAFAYLKINYHAPDFIWQSEEYRFDGENNANAGDFFTSQTFNVDIELIIPEFELPTTDPLLLTFDDVIVDIKVSDLFGTPVVTKSRFELEFIPGDELYSAWGLTFDVIDKEKPENGTASGGSFGGGGYIELNADGSGTGGGHADFNYYLDNWIYRRHDMEWVLDSNVYFVNDLGSLTIEKVAVTEPFSLGLLFTGLAFILLSRRQTQRKVS